MIKALIFSLSPPPLYIWRQWSFDGNAAAGELSRIFVKTLRLRKDNVRPAVRDQVCGSACLRQGPGLMVRCTAYEHVLLRLLNAAHHVWLDMRGMTYVRFYAPEVAASGR
jgi:hypothetical protein